MIGWRELQWKGDKLYIGTRSSGYSVVQDATYPTMWRVRKAGKLSGMVNRTRAKDAAMTMLTQELNARETAGEAGRSDFEGREVG